MERTEFEALRQAANYVRTAAQNEAKAIYAAAMGAADRKCLDVVRTARRALRATVAP